MKQTTVGMTLSGLLAVCLLACAHGPEKTVTTAESPKEHEKSDQGVKAVPGNGQEVIAQQETVGGSVGIDEEMLGTHSESGEGIEPEKGDAGVKLVPRDAGAGFSGAVGGGSGGQISGFAGGGKSGWVRIDEVTLSGAGTVDADVIGDVLFDFGGLNACAAIHFESAPPDAIGVKVRFTVAANAVVSGVSVLTKDIDAAVLKCIEERVWLIENFPQPKGGEVVVNAAMLFSP